MAARHAEHRRAAVLVILALLTILSVSWRLHQVGIAMTDDEYSCGYEEHVHSDACYTEVLICGYEDGASETPADSAEEDGEAAPTAHSHTADCYQRVLTCTIPEHTHTLECLADITADVETPADWDEQSEGVSSFWSDAMTEIAQRQLGYTESAKNFTVDKALGETLAQAHHYTRYGDWYGNPYGSWDVMFVAFCQHYAGIPEDVIPQCASLLQLRTELENAHPEYITPGGSEATPGDIVLYTNAAGEETIGIVTAYDGANLTVVSGAVDGAVAAVTVAEADVTNTIRVLDAYGVYAQTGASDGSEELSFDADAILARDGAVAYIVWQRPDPIMPAAEDDDTLTAAAATPQYDGEGNLKLDNLLTSTAISINQSGTWEPLDNFASIKDGTQVQVEIVYSVPANAFKPGSNTATYTLPAGVYPKGDLSGNITDSTGTIIGTFALSKKSPTVTFTFNNDTSRTFTGTFKFNTTINYAETGGDGKIHLGEKTYTVEPEYSLNTKKEHTLSEDKSISVWRQMPSALNPSSWPRFWPSRCYLRHWSVCWLPHICASAAREGGNNIMKSIRDRLAVLLMLCLLVWGAVPALAAETVDETCIGSIKVLLCDTETAAPLQGGELTLYRVASVSKNGADMSFTYANGFENCGIALDNVSESALASRLAEKVTQNAQAVTKTVNDSGIAVFGDLKAGLYLIVQKQAAEGYDAIQPFLVTVPIMENGQYVYDVDAHPKAGTSSRKTTQTPPTQEVLSALPQTGQLNWPVPVLAVTGAVLVAAGVVLKKRSGQNEK